MNEPAATLRRILEGIGEEKRLLVISTEEAKKTMDSWHEGSMPWISAANAYTAALGQITGLVTVRQIVAAELRALEETE